MTPRGGELDVADQRVREDRGASLCRQAEQECVKAPSIDLQAGGAVRETGGPGGLVAPPDGIPGTRQKPGRVSRRRDPEQLEQFAAARWQRLAQ